MWAELPASLIILIFNHLDTECRLHASAICRRWRDVVLESSTVVLKRNQIVEFICGRRGQCMADDDVRMMIKFLANIRTVTIKWCVCKTDKLLQCLNVILEVKYFPVKHIKIKGSLSMCPKMCDSSALCNQEVFERKVKLFTSLLQLCKSLKFLDFGFEADLSQNINIVKTVMDKIIGGKLYTLNIAAVQRTESINYQYGLFETANCLNRLSALCLNWDKYFIELINILSTGPNFETRLKMLIVVLSPLYYFSEYTVTEGQWAKLSKFQPLLKMKLVLVEKDMIEHFHPEQMYDHVLANENIPMQALAVISDNPYMYFPRNFFFNSRHCVHKLAEISYHYVEIRRQMEIADSDIFSSDYLNHFTTLERLELCGMFIEDSTVIQIGTHFGRRLKDLVVYQMDVLHRSEVTGYLLPLSRSQVYGVEKAVTAALGRDWTLVKQRHTHRSIGGNILSKIESVLQDICDITEI